MGVVVISTKNRSIIDRKVDIDEIFRDIKKTIHTPSSQQEKFFNDSCNILNNYKQNNKITCFPAMPGIGKSTFIKAYIKQCAIKVVGLIVLTDRWNLIESFREIKNQYTNKISILEENMSYSEIKSELKTKPIIIMTTQRFFAFDEEFRELLYTYKYRRFGQYRRNIIIDECPIFHQKATINIKKLHSITGEVFSNLNEDTDDRYEVFNTLKRGEDKFIEFIKMQDEEYEEDTYFFVTPYELSQINDAFSSFFERIEDDKTFIQGCSMETIENINVLKSILEEGAIFKCTKKHNGHEYSNEFIYYKSKQECLEINQKYCKVVIFDGTCDINPLYKKDIFEIKDNSDYMRKINLALNCVDVPTAKIRLTNPKNRYAICNYIDEKNIPDALYITHKEYLKEMFKDYSYTNYFGNIKGSNEYKDITQMFHVGLNMFSTLEYFFILCDNNERLYNYISLMSHEESIELFHKIIKREDDCYANGLNISDAIENVKAHSLLSDFEQNVFRLSIRNSNNIIPNTCWLFFHHSHENYELFSILLENRFKKYGATVSFLEPPLLLALHKILERKQTEKTNVQKVLLWLIEKEPNQKFTSNEIKESLNINDGAFNKVKKSKLGELFAQLKINGSNKYIINDNIAEMLKSLK